MTGAILNIAAYRFVELDDLDSLRQRLEASASARGLKGTVLLAGEGINLVLAGATAALEGWLTDQGADPRLAALPLKRSFSERVPFRQLRVKVKREIIRMNLPAIRPAAARAPAVAPMTLARWLLQGHDDDGRPLRMLDTRNAFEVDAGAFDGAIDWRLSRFSDFPAALAQHRAELEGCTVVSYCTGGIRCEKAALLMCELGIEHGLQLDGGILGYFEATGGRAPGWRGHCVVFDERGALNSDLAAQPAMAAQATQAA